MEFVCNDLDGISPWHYNADDGHYYRNFLDGRHQGRIAARDIPDPNLLWKTRLDTLEKAAAMGVKVNQDDRNKAKPSATTFTLWEHKHRIENA